MKAEMYWAGINKMQQKQTEKGIKKYGQILEENTEMTIKERIEYLQEELINALMYCEHIKADIPGEISITANFSSKTSELIAEIERRRRCQE